MWRREKGLYPIRSSPTVGAFCAGHIRGEEFVWRVTMAPSVKRDLGVYHRKDRSYRKLREVRSVPTESPNSFISGTLP